MPLVELLPLNGSAPGSTGALFLCPEKKFAATQKKSCALKNNYYL